MISFIVLFIAGGLVGFLSGLLGLGGATIMVPLYIYYFKIQNVLPPEQQFHMAVGCSLIVIFFNSVIATREHYLNQTIDTSLFKKFLPGLLVGILMGTALSSSISGVILKKLFAVFLIMVALKIFFQKNKTKQYPFPEILFHATALLVGVLNTLFGVAGGIVMVPFFNQIGVDIKKSIGTSIALAVPISVIASITLNLSSPYLLINWTVVIATAIGSALCIPLGAKTSQKTEPQLLKKIFAVILLLIAVVMFLSH